MPSGATYSESIGDAVDGAGEASGRTESSRTVQSKARGLILRGPSPLHPLAGPQTAVRRVSRSQTGCSHTDNDELGHGLPESTRIEAASDAIFAIALTRLVLDLHAPDEDRGGFVHARRPVAGLGRLSGRVPQDPATKTRT